MIAQSEKAALRADSLSSLGILSVAIALLGDLGAALGASWAWRVFFGLSNAFLDVVFCFECALIVLGIARSGWNRPRPSSVSMLAAVMSSAVPLAFASGPFILAWMSQGDLSSLVRGLYAWPKPQAAFASLAALRLFRLVLPCTTYRNFSGDYQQGPAHDSSKARPATAFVALSLFVSLCFLASIARDAWLVPGLGMSIAQTRQQTVNALSQTGTPGTGSVSTPNYAAALGPDVAWSSWLGSRADLVSFLSDDGTYRAWFDARTNHRAHGAYDAAVSLAALGAWLAYTILERRRQPKKGTHSATGIGRPTGQDELAGLLGRR